MSDELLHFFSAHPFWAILIIVFMALPIMGAVLHIVLKAFGRKGIDVITPDPPDPEQIMTDDEAGHTNHGATETRGKSNQ